MTEKYSCLENPMDRRAWPATVSKSLMWLKQLSTTTQMVKNGCGYRVTFWCLPVDPFMIICLISAPHYQGKPIVFSQVNSCTSHFTTLPVVKWDVLTWPRCHVMIMPSPPRSREQTVLCQTVPRAQQALLFLIKELPVLCVLVEPLRRERHHHLALPKIQNSPP